MVFENYLGKLNSNTIVLGLGFGMALTAFEAWRYPVIWINLASTPLSQGSYACIILILALGYYGLGKHRVLVRTAPLVIVASFLTVTLFCYGSLEHGEPFEVVRWLAALHMAAGVAFIVLWIEELLSADKQAAVWIFAIGLIVAFAAQCAVILLNSSMAHGVCSMFPLVSASLFLLGQSDAQSFFSHQSLAANTEAWGKKPQGFSIQIIITGIFALACGVLFNVMNKAWQTNIAGSASISEFNVQLFSALGSFVAAALLIATPQKNRQQLVALYITVLTLVALLASNMGGAVFPLYLVPLNAAQKLSYALLFLIALDQKQLRWGMLAFCGLFLMYRWGLSLLTPMRNLLQSDAFGLTDQGATYVIIVTGAACLLVYALISVLQIARTGLASGSPDSAEDNSSATLATGQPPSVDKETLEKYKAIAFQYYCSQKYRLTSREAEIALLLESGGTQRSIAETLVISQGTAKCHIRNVYTKLGVHSKEEAIAEMTFARQEFFEA